MAPPLCCVQSRATCRDAGRRAYGTTHVAQRNRIATKKVVIVWLTVAKSGTIDRQEVHEADEGGVVVESPTDADDGGRPAVAERINVALIAEAAEAIEKLRHRTGLKKVDIVNRALSIYEFIDAELRAGNRIIIRDQDGNDQVVKIFF
jgi:hypothetical protein